MPDIPDRITVNYTLDPRLKEAWKQACMGVGVSMAEGFRRMILLATARPELLVAGMTDRERAQAGSSGPAAMERVSTAFGQLRALYAADEMSDGAFERWVTWKPEHATTDAVYTDIAQVVALVDQVVDHQRMYATRQDFIRWAVRMLLWLEVRGARPKMEAATKYIETSLLLATAQGMSELGNMRYAAAKYVEKVADELDEMDEAGLLEARRVVEELLTMVPEASLTWTKMREALREIRGKMGTGARRRKMLRQNQTDDQMARVDEEWPDNRKFDHRLGKWVIEREDGSTVPVPDRVEAGTVVGFDEESGEGLTNVPDWIK